MLASKIHSILKTRRYNIVPVAAYPMNSQRGSLANNCYQKYIIKPLYNRCRTR